MPNIKEFRLGRMKPQKGIESSSRNKIPTAIDGLVGGYIRGPKERDTIIVYGGHNRRVGPKYK